VIADKNIAKWVARQGNRKHQLCTYGWACKCIWFYSQSKSAVYRLPNKRVATFQQFERNKRRLRRCIRFNESHTNNFTKIYLKRTIATVAGVVSGETVPHHGGHHRWLLFELHLTAVAKVHHSCARMVSMVDIEWPQVYSIITFDGGQQCLPYNIRTRFVFVTDENCKVRRCHQKQKPRSTTTCAGKIAWRITYTHTDLQTVQVKP